MASPSILSGTPIGGGPRFEPSRRPYSTRYKPSITEIMTQREGRTGAYDQQGQQVRPGTVLYSPGWNTSGVGPGTRGYRGSGGIQGYSFQNQGGAASKRPDYSANFGGLNEFYQMQQGLSDFDRLQGRAGMDQADAAGSRLAILARAAEQRGDLEGMNMYSSMLSDRLAQRMAAQGNDSWASMGMPQTGEDFGGIPTSFGNQAPNVDVDPNSEFAQTLLDQAAVDDRRRSGMVATDVGRFQTPYGSASVGGPSQSTFTNAQGSAGPGGTMTNYGGVETGQAFFRGAADRQRTGNAFAQPAPGYNGKPADDLASFSERLLAAKQRLGKK